MHSRQARYGSAAIAREDSPVVTHLPGAVRPSARPGPATVHRIARALLARSERSFVYFHTALAFGVLAIASGETLPWCAALGATYALFGKGLDAFSPENRFAPMGVTLRLTFATGAAMLFAGMFLGHAAAVALPAIGLAAIVLHLTGARFLASNPRRFVVVDPLGAAATELRQFCEQAPPYTLGQYYRFEEVAVFETGAIGGLEVIVPRDGKVSPAAHARISAAIASGASLRDEIRFFEEALGRLPLEGNMKDFRFVNEVPLDSAFEDWLTRGIDIVVAALGIVLLLPLFAAIAAAIKLTSHGPVLFLHERQGRYKRPFRMLKFRTMTHTDNPRTHLFTAANDARVTPVGAFLRHFHLDELPQLGNILLGDMSLVGPRPEMLAFAERMENAIPAYEVRYTVRPGLTGLAQVRQGYALEDNGSTLRKLSYDLYYLRHRSAVLWLALVWRTAFFIWHDTHYRRLHRDDAAPATPAAPHEQTSPPFAGTPPVL